MAMADSIPQIVVIGDCVLGGCVAWPAKRSSGNCSSEEPWLQAQVSGDMTTLRQDFT